MWAYQIKYLCYIVYVDIQHIETSIIVSHFYCILCYHFVSPLPGFFVSMIHKMYKGHYLFLLWCNSWVIDPLCLLEDKRLPFSSWLMGDPNSEGVWRDLWNSKGAIQGLKWAVRQLK